MEILLYVLSSLYLIHFIVTALVFIKAFIKEKPTPVWKYLVLIILLFIPITVLITKIQKDIWDDKVKQLKDIERG